MEKDLLCAGCCSPISGIQNLTSASWPAHSKSLHSGDRRDPMLCGEQDWRPQHDCSVLFFWEKKVSEAKCKLPHLLPAAEGIKKPVKQYTGYPNDTTILWSRFVSITQHWAFLLLTFQPQSPFRRDKAQRISVKVLSTPAHVRNKDNIK